MKRFILNCAAVATVAVATLPDLLIPAFAQTADGATKTIAANELRVREIAVKNVPVKVMAWWLDKQHNAEPLVFKQSRLNREATGYTDFPEVQSAVESLPASVNSVVVASEARNSILVVGTQSGIETVEAVVKNLDVPLRQIEVEVQAVQISQADVEKLGLKFSVLEGEINAGRATPITMARTADNHDLRSKVRDMMFWNQEKIISSPRVTAINGLTARLGNTKSSPVLMGIDEAHGFPLQVLDNSTKALQVVLYREDFSGLTVTPTLHENQMIALDLIPAKTLQLSLSQAPKLGEEASAAHMGTVEGFHHKLTVADDETVIFGGVSSALYSRDSEDENDQRPANIILLVKARILPRVGE